MFSSVQSSEQSQVMVEDERNDKTKGKTMTAAKETKGQLWGRLWTVGVPIIVVANDSGVAIYVDEPQRRLLAKARTERKAIEKAIERAPHMQDLPSCR